MIKSINQLIDIDNIQNHTIEHPNAWTVFGSLQDFENLPQAHRLQIQFLNKDASKFLYNYLSAAHLITGDLWNPFEKNNFKSVAEYSNFLGTDDSKKSLKKWLYNRGIAFDTKIFILPNTNNYPVITTWKMVVKYGSEMFFADDITVFDTTLNWCLFYYHEDKLFFGKDYIYYASEDEK